MDAEWVEGCLMLPSTNLSGRHGLPYLGSHNAFLVGDAINKPTDRARLPEVLDTSGATPLPEGFVIGGRGGATYGHWLLDFVPQILTAQKVTRRLGLDAPIIVINYTPFGRRLLKFMGLDDRCFFVPRDQMLQVERLYCPLITKVGHRYCIEVLKDSYAHLLALSEPGRNAAKREGLRKILIGRRKPPFCNNFDALRAALEPKGFTVVYPEDFHYRKQFQIFHNASVIVGEDGSAMHNAGFCRPGTPLIVFSRADKVNFWHAPVAQAAGLPLHYLQSRMLEDGERYDAPIQDILNAI